MFTNDHDDQIYQWQPISELLRFSSTKNHNRQPITISVHHLDFDDQWQLINKEKNRPSAFQLLVNPLRLILKLSRPHDRYIFQLCAVCFILLCMHIDPCFKRSAGHAKWMRYPLKAGLKLARGSLRVPFLAPGHHHASVNHFFCSKSHPSLGPIKNWYPGQIYFENQTNISSNLDKYIMQFGQIHLTI